MPRLLVVAHRGASKAFRENTVEAFRGAAAMGADMVELDVRRAADGALVVHHDPITERPDYAPTLAEALDACEAMRVNIEIKNDPREADFDPLDTLAYDVVALLHTRYEPLANWLISSFNPATIGAVRMLSPGLETGFLFTRPLLPLPDIAAAGHVAIHPYDRIVTAELVAEAHSRGLAVNTWTVDQPARMRELAALGIDAIITNVPDIARSTLA